VPTGDELRTIMRRFPVGVAVLTVDDDGARHGITVGSLASLSLDPVLVAVSLGRDTIAHGLVRSAGGYAISLLAGDQDHLAQHFARSVPPIAQWQGIAVKPAAWRGPLLEGALGWLDCRSWAEYAGGDHTIFVGEVERLELGVSGEGLVYRESGYHPV
jgi:flavin reductase